MNYFAVINRVERVLGRPVTSSFSDLANEFQLNIKSLVNQVNKDVLMAFTYPCRERTTTLAVAAETTNDYKAVTNSISGEIKCIYCTDDEVYYKYEPDVSEFILGKTQAYDYGFRNNLIYFTADEDARSLKVDYYTNKLALAATAYEDFVEGTTTEKEEMTLETDYSILPSFVHEPILVYGTCFYYELQKNESMKVIAFKDRFQAGVRQLNAHNRSDEQGFVFQLGNLDIDLRRGAV